VSALQDGWRKRVGSIAQIVRADQVTVSDGAGYSSRRIEVDTGGGLTFEVLPDREFDIGRASFRGSALAWMGSVGHGPGSGVGDKRTDWLSGFGGGLLATCGLDSIGPASFDGGREHGLHGRIGRMAAQVTRCEVTSHRITLAATVRQSTMFAETLRLDRTMTAEVGGATIEIVDLVTNEGPDPEGHMILYHCNLGWPLLDDGAYVEGPGGATVGRDPVAEAGLATWDQVHGPSDPYPEQVFIHDAPGPEARVRLVNPRSGMALMIKWDSSTLPAMFQWKYLRKFGYAMGLEPVNTRATFGRARARADGDLPILAPGESRRYRLAISVSMQ